MKKLLLPALLVAVVAFVVVIAQEKMGMDHSHHKMNHAAHKSDDKLMPKEFGEAGFAAIAEIVTLLSNDPSTDWSKVNINGLREHLIMMNQLVLGAKVDEQEITEGRRLTVSGEGAVLKAIQQMVPAHAAELNKMSEFNASTSLIEGGVKLDVTANAPKINEKIKGLGFFGLMAIGSHHQRHHLMMATGHKHH